MADERDLDIVRRSLEGVETIRRRITLAGYVVVAGTVAAFIWLNYVARTGTNPQSVLMSAVLALVCVIAWSTFALAIFMTRMTKRILRAIDLAR